METFVSEKDTKSIISSTFINISLIILGMVLGGLLYWSYIKTDKLYITLLSGILFGYTLMMIIFIAMIRAKLTENEFKIYMSASIFMAILTLAIFVIFLIRTIYHFKGPSPVAQPPQAAAQVYQQPTLATQYNQYQEYPNPLLQQRQTTNSLV
jgi:hypothetical protein